MNLNWLNDIIKSAVEKKFNGNIQINFFKGGVTKVTKQEVIQPPVGETPSQIMDDQIRKLR